MIKMTVHWQNGKAYSAPLLICDGCGLPIHIPQEGICFCYPTSTDLYMVHHGACARTLAAILRPNEGAPHWLPIEHVLRSRPQVYDTGKRLKT